MGSEASPHDVDSADGIHTILIFVGHVHREIGKTVTVEVTLGCASADADSFTSLMETIGISRSQRLLTRIWQSMPGPALPLEPCEDWATPLICGEKTRLSEMMINSVSVETCVRDF